MTGTTNTEFTQGAQLLQLLWESFALDLYRVERVPAKQRERAILDAGAGVEKTLRRLGFVEQQTEVYRALYIESLRSYLEFPARERGAFQ